MAWLAKCGLCFVVVLGISGVIPVRAAADDDPGLRPDAGANVAVDLSGVSTVDGCAAMLGAFRSGVGTKTAEQFTRTLEAVLSKFQKPRGFIAHSMRLHTLSSFIGNSTSRAERRRITAMENDIATWAANIHAAPLIAYRVFRGPKEIRPYIGSFKKNLAELDQDVKDEMKKRNSEGKWPIGHVLAQLPMFYGFFWNFWSWYSQGDQQGLNPAIAFGAISAAVAIANEYMMPIFLDIHGLDQHMDLIERAIDGHVVDKDQVSMVSGTVNNAPASLSRELFGAGSTRPVDVGMMTTVRERYMEGLAAAVFSSSWTHQFNRDQEITEEANETVSNPLEMRRRLFFDSMFYYDDAMGEWVLAVIYRARVRLAPSKPGHGGLIFDGAT